MIRLVYGTSNQAKIQHMKQILKELNIEIQSLNDVENLELEPIEESGNTPIENARIKAMAYYKAIKRPIFSCDSGLYIDNLENKRQPGVHVRRVKGKELNDQEMIEYYTNLAKELGGVAKAKYKNAICLIMDEKNIYEYDGEDIASEKFLITSKAHSKRIDGFPLDSISLDLETGQYYLDMNESNNLDDEDKFTKGFRNFFQKAVLK